VFIGRDEGPYLDWEEMMSSRYWTVEDFQEHRPVFRSSSIEKLLLGVALLPFTIGSVYWVWCIGFKPVMSPPEFAMWASIGLGALMALAGAMVGSEWVEDFHYERLHKHHDAVARCERLIREVLADEQFFQAWATSDKRRAFMAKLDTAAQGSLGRINVERVDEPKVMEMIKAWIEFQEEVAVPIEETVRESSEGA
jgi:hypothetical protein